MIEGESMIRGGRNDLSPKASDTLRLEPLTPDELKEMLALAIEINSRRGLALIPNSEPTRLEIRYSSLFQRNEFHLQKDLRRYRAIIHQLTTELNAVILKINILFGEYATWINQINTIANWNLAAVDLYDLTKIQSHICNLESSLVDLTAYYHKSVYRIQANKT